MGVVPLWVERVSWSGWLGMIRGINGVIARFQAPVFAAMVKGAVSRVFLDGGWAWFGGMM